MSIMKRFKNEEGSMSLEFIGILPFLFLFLLLLWQVVALGTAILSAQSAVNEAAKVYAVSENAYEAEQTARDIVGTGDVMSFISFNIPTQETNGHFEVKLNVLLSLSFLPDGWASYPFNLTANGRLLDYE